MRTHTHTHKLSTQIPHSECMQFGFRFPFTFGDFRLVENLQQPRNLWLFYGIFAKLYNFNKLQLNENQQTSVQLPFDVATMKEEGCILSIKCYSLFTLGAVRCYIFWLMEFVNFELYTASILRRMPGTFCITYFSAIWSCSYLCNASLSLSLWNHFSRFVAKVIFIMILISK